MAQESMLPVYRTSEVFVAGAPPTRTYVAREERLIERQILRFLSDSGKALTVYGGTKSGKTTLVERVLPPEKAIWVHGQDLHGVDDLWRAIAMSLDLATELQNQESTQVTNGSTREVSAGASSFAGLKHADNEQLATTRARSRGARPPIHEVARQGLAREPRPIVIDDWHFIQDSTRLDLTRAIKTLVRIAPVLLIAVPADSFDAVRREPEMAGRIWHLEVPPWSVAELLEIAMQGFKLLNLSDAGGEVASRLAVESYGSPFIMQQLCHDLVRWEHEIEETQGSETPLTLPVDERAFLRECADRTEPAIFSALCLAPGPRGPLGPRSESPASVQLTFTARPSTPFNSACPQWRFPSVRSRARSTKSHDRESWRGA